MRAITALSIASDAIRANTSRRFRCPLELWWMAKWWTPKWSPVY